MRGVDLFSRHQRSSSQQTVDGGDPPKDTISSYIFTNLFPLDNIGPTSIINRWRNGIVTHLVGKQEIL